MNPGTVYAVSCTAATSVPARVFRLSGRGVIEPGARADLALVSGDPTTDITATRRIGGVWKRGIEVDREAWRRSIELEESGCKTALCTVESERLGRDRDKRF